MRTRFQGFADAMDTLRFSLNFQRFLLYFLRFLIDFFCCLVESHSNSMEFNMEFLEFALLFNGIPIKYLWQCIHGNPCKSMSFLDGPPKAGITLPLQWSTSSFWSVLRCLCSDPPLDSDWICDACAVVHILLLIGFAMACAVVHLLILIGSALPVPLSTSWFGSHWNGIETG